MHIGCWQLWNKYVGKEHANHLKQAREVNYKLTCDWMGTHYIGITLDWNYTKRQVHLSMPNYVTKASKRFQHIAKKWQYAPYPCVPIHYGAKKQYTMLDLKAPLLDEGNGYSVLLAVCSAICPASFGRVLPICMGQNILANESIYLCHSFCKWMG